ncbi:MAG: response regulator transcription factor [Desulfobacterales bacterium]|nr:response regulator transcription factor [Desulfobacterales bacterium]
MGKETILVVDDEEDILELVRFHLSREGFGVVCAETGEEAWRKVKENPVDLMVIDLMLPGMDGLELTRRLKNDAQTRPIPVVMLSAKGEEADIVTGLELGADDYITKPFSPRVLLARVRAVFRRRAAPSPAADVIRIHGLTIDRGRRSLTTFTEFQVLAFLAGRPGWVFTRSQIVDAVRGDDYPVTDRSVDVQIVGLRKKLGDLGHLVETVRGVGYRFKEKS